MGIAAARLLLSVVCPQRQPLGLPREEIKMRTFQPIAAAFAACLLICGLIAPAFAQEVTTREAAADRARAEGYSLVSKTDPAPGAWDVWASRDGIAYEVKIDARDGSVIKAIPVEDND